MIKTFIGPHVSFILVRF